MQTEKYNGWTNYETWNVNLWMDNDQGSQEYWNERAQEEWNSAEADDICTREENAVYALGNAIKDQHEEFAPEISGTYADLLNAALSEVNWFEISRHYIDEVDKTEEVEDENDDE